MVTVAIVNLFTAHRYKVAIVKGKVCAVAEHLFPIKYFSLVEFQGFRLTGMVCVRAHMYICVVHAFASYIVRVVLVHMCVCVHKHTHTLCYHAHLCVRVFYSVPYHTHTHACTRCVWVLCVYL